MPIQSYKLGPGTLKLGAAGVMDISCQVRTCRVVPTENATTSDDIDVLCGEVLKGDTTVSYTYVLEGTLLQDLAAAGVVDYSWTNKGLPILFEFVPATASARKVTGTVRMAPLVIGGDVKTRPTSDFSWTCTVDPVFAATP